jgi:hypothetical protein
MHHHYVANEVRHLALLAWTREKPMDTLEVDALEGAASMS